MLLSDNEIRNLANDLIEGFDDSRLGSISYDLETEDFCIGNGVRSRTLKPLDSVFVRSKEASKRFDSKSRPPQQQTQAGHRLGCPCIPAWT